jgi:branched-chain amino acid transport system substrate-binding protein
VNKPLPAHALRAASRLALALLLLSASPAGCSLSNVGGDACQADKECSAVFGVGSKCDDGYCTDPGACTTGHDCRMKYGGGACVDGTCVELAPQNAACDVVEPADLFSKPLAGPGAPLVIGAIFAKEDAKNRATAAAVRLAVREINDSTGVTSGQSLGLVVCDNGGPGNAAAGADRTALDHAALDYLAGTLGVPFLVGPRTSSDALKIAARLVEKKYPTVVISPSATSPELTGVPSRINDADPYPLFWRTCPSDALQGKVLAEQVIGSDAAIAVTSVVYTNDAYGQGLSQVFQKSFKPEVPGSTRLAPFDASKLDDAGYADGIASMVAGHGSQAIVIVAVSAAHTIKLLGALSAAGLGGSKFFFTDGSKDATKLLDPALPEDVKGIIAGARGTAPASARDAATFDLFSASLLADFPEANPTQFSFLAHAYDATYLGALGIVFASAKGKPYDGRGVAEGLAQLATGEAFDLGGLTWPAAKQALTKAGKINVRGISGELDLDPQSGEGPAPIEVWHVNDAGTGFATEGPF